MEQSYSLEIRQLSKTYQTSFGRRKIEALKNLDLNVLQGSIFGLLGPNGAGKTTLIKLLLGITFPDNGNAKILNKPMTDIHVKKRIGYLPENHKYPMYLSGAEVLRFYGKLSGLDSSSIEKRIDELLALVNLTKWKKTKVKAYSKGMMQRLGLAQALINDPDLIFLDEPTDGVDPIGRKEIRDILSNLKDRGKTIFLNSHLLSEVELVSDRVGILNKGILIKEGTVKELTERREEYKFTFDGEVDQSLPEFSNFEKKKDFYHVRVEGVEELNKTIDLLRMKGILIKEISPEKSSLEEMFISLIKAQDSTDSRIPQQNGSIR